MRTIQQGYYDQLRNIAADAEAVSLVEEVDALVVDKKARRLRYADIGVTCLTIGVGVCMMLGLFTRLAAVCGMAFLLTVMATQPPWIEGARIDLVYYQLVEVAALVVLLFTAAGRFAGLDFFLHALFSKRGERN
jgi:uncharacterized membrane protein YphA (DoxX/SURF4 family)